MRDRTGICNGTFEISSEIRKGTKVMRSLPYRFPQQAMGNALASAGSNLKKKKGFDKYLNHQTLDSLVPGTRLELVQPLWAEGF